MERYVYLWLDKCQAPDNHFSLQLFPCYPQISCCFWPVVVCFGQKSFWHPLDSLSRLLYGRSHCHWSRRSFLLRRLYLLAGNSFRVLTFDRYNRNTQQFALLYAAELQTLFGSFILYKHILPFMHVRTCSPVPRSALLFLGFIRCAMCDFIYFRLPLPTAAKKAHKDFQNADTNLCRHT